MVSDPTARAGRALGVDIPLSTSQAAAIAGVHPRTIRNWAAAGRLPCRYTPGGNRRFRREDVEALLTAGERS